MTKGKSYKKSKVITEEQAIEVLRSAEEFVDAIAKKLLKN